MDFKVGRATGELPSVPRNEGEAAAEVVEHTKSPHSSDASAEDSDAAEASTDPPVESDNSEISVRGQGQASVLSLGLDDALPGAPDRSVNSESRFPERGRGIYLPLLRADQGGLQLNNPLPFSGLSSTDHDLGGLVLEGSPQSAERIFTSIDAPSQMIAALVDELSARYPKLEKNVAYRLAVAATYVAVDVPLMVAAHEMGHGASALDACPSCNPQVTMNGWMSGYTAYNVPEGAEISENERILMSVAGMNQATYNGDRIQERMHTRGADLKDAIGYLANITNSVNYQMKDWITQSAPGFNDAATYHAAMEAREDGWNQQNLSLLALGVNLANADFWASLIGSVRYIATGEQVQTFGFDIDLGERQAHISPPLPSLYLTPEGPQLNVSMYGDLGTPATLELTYSQILTPENGPAFGVETALHNLMIPGTQEQLSLSPRVGFSTHNARPGFKVGSGLSYRPGNNPHVALQANIDYRHNYMPDQTLPGMSGLQADMGLELSF